MSEEQRNIEERNLVFIGAPRAGKTCLMAAWYEFLQSFPGLGITDVFEEGVYDIPRIKAVWKEIKEKGHAPSPTEQGLVRTNRVEFCYRNRDYAFNFVDLSGETATQAFSNELGDKEIEEEIVGICRDSDQLFLVVSLEDYSKENRNPLADLLSFLDQVIKRPDFQTLFRHGLCVYMSHAEKLEESELKKCETKIRERILRFRPNLKADLFHTCTSVIEENSEKIRFTNESDQFPPNRLFHEVFADLTAIDPDSSTARVISKAKQVTSTKRGRIVIFGSLIFLGFLFGSFNWFLSQQKEASWQKHIESFVAIDAEAATEENLPQKRSAMQQWREVAREQYPKRYIRDEYDTKLREIENLFTSIETEKKESGDLKEALQELVDLHKTNYIRLYPSILRVAENALANPGQWSAQATQQWSDIQRLIQALQEGAYLQIKRPSFVTNLNEDFVLEFHIFARDETNPWGKDATPKSIIKGIRFKEENQVKQKKGQYRLAWSDDEISTVLYRPEKDQITIRFMDERLFGHGESLKYTIPSQGIHGLAVFDRELRVESSDGSNWFRFNFKNYTLRDSEMKPLIIPEVLEEVFP